MTGRVALVLGGGTGLGRELAWGLTDAGMSVAVIGPSGDEPQVAAALEADGRRAVAVHAAVAAPAGLSAAFGTAADSLGPPDLVVHALTDPAALVAAPIAETEPSAWDERCEAVLRAALACAQAAWEVLQGRGGRIVFVTPTVALTGAAQLVPYASAVEGIRALAKSAARQWGTDGITVNCVAPPVELLGDATSPPGLEAAALGREPDARADVAPVLALLAAPGAHFVTGTTIVLDGGRVMAP
jgi:NAD(P)-dependent dehydrogenase (short-subunit alcohol dehydrogenase family)